MSFVHLHVHSMYSLLDGFSDPKKLIARAIELAMPAVAISDHGTMFGVIEFFEIARKAGIKPIIGLETYMAARGMTDRDAHLDKRSSHLLLLAENDIGYKNLLQIASAAQLDGFYYYPRIDHDYLAAHSDGLIASTACMSGEVPRAILNGDIESATKKLDWYYEVFSPDRFFLELQRHDQDELENVNRALLDLGRRYKARYIATNDVHYINQADARLQDILLAIQTGALLSDSTRFHMNNDSYYLRSPQEMAALFSDIPEAIFNTLLVAERCQVDLSSKGYHLPDFTVPHGHTPETYLRQLCEEGLKRRYVERAAHEKVRQRLEYELKIIHQMGFDSYFLIVWDVCRYATEHNIWYNARGSAAGSMVAYVLDITLVEPLNHGLIFERFLNPDRVNMPDIDLDFQDDKRSQVMEYCAQKYGSDKVAQIITFGTLGARAAIRDVGRVMDIPLIEVDRVSKTIPNIPGKPVSITEALETMPDLKKLYDESNYLHELIDTASQMEGVIRSAGTHAAGVVITDQPVINYCPLHRPTNGSEESPIKTVTQFEMSIIDALGLLKIDFLGLSTLTIMAKASDLIYQRHNISLNLNNIPLDDLETFNLLGEGHTAGVFQLEGSGMTRYLVQMKPNSLDHIIAMVALYRPGPIDFIPSYIQRMHGVEEVSYRHPALEPIFCETYGIPIYQEQIMLAAISLAGYTASESDDLRKAIAKKKIESLMQHRKKFIKGAVTAGINEQIATEIFEDWENFARYGFNKSHAADYGVIAVETAYLKTHFTVEYMTALLSASKNDCDKVAFYIIDCRNLDIDVLPPDVNFSGYDFTIEDRNEHKPAIRFGLGAVKNVGYSPVELILTARAEKPFRDLNDFTSRVDLRQVGKRPLESLIRVGALDALGPRNALLDSLDRIISISAAHFRAIQSGQLSFFGLAGGMEEEITVSSGTFVDRRAHLEWERELLGLYVSDHPLTHYLPKLRRKTTHMSNQLAEGINKSNVVVGGIITRFHQHNTRNGKQMAFVTLDDMAGNIELVVFSRAWEQFADLISVDQVVCVTGKLDLQNGDPKVLVDNIELETLEPENELQHQATPQTYQEPVPDHFIPPADEPWEVELGDGPESLLSEIHELPETYSLVNSEGFNNVAIQDFVKGQPPLAKETVTTLEGLEVVEPWLEKLSIPPYLSSPVVQNGDQKETIHPRMLRVVLRSIGEKDRDRRRLRRIHGALCASPGKDRFSFLVFERGHHYLIEFPNDTTGISNDLVHKLSELVGGENIIVEPL